LSRSPIALSALAVAATLALSACGGSGGDAQDGSNDTGSSNGQRGSSPFAALQDKEVQACLKKQGVTVPTGPPGGGQMPYGGGRPPENGQPPENFQPPEDGQQPPQDGQRPPGGGISDELRAAAKKCGVTLPEQGQGAPPSRTQTTTAATAG
jgi:hypothetical protein